MASEIIMPKVDMVMETGTFVEWLKGEGEEVKKGEPLFVIMSDKSAIEIDAPASGTLAGLTAKKDDVIPVAQTIGFILVAGESLPKKEPAMAPQATVPAPQEAAPAVPAVAVPVVPAAPTIQAGEGVRATPLARKLAKQMGIDLHLLQGRGSRGRIHKADVLAYGEKGAQALSSLAGLPQAAMNVPLPEARVRQRIALKGVREIIARRMAYSTATIPHIYENVTVNMSELVRMRARIAPAYEEKYGRKPSYTVMLVHAAGKMLLRHPNLNSSLVGNEVVQWENIHIGVATSLEDYLIVPVVRDVQERNLESIVEEMERLLSAARARKLEPREMSGSTFTISNLGMFKIESFTAIINPPEAAILAVGAMEEAPCVVDGKLSVQPLMKMTIGVDHRINDGVAAANFLADLKDALENPYLLI